MNHNFARAAAQTRTLPLAIARGEEWTPLEVEFLEGFADASAEELALALGRTVYGVNGARDRLRAGLPVGGGHTQAKPAGPSWTFIGKDVPPGW